GQPGPGGQNAGFDFEGFDFSNPGGNSFTDIFSDLFGSIRGGKKGAGTRGGGAQTVRALRGDDILYPINIGLMDAVRGVSTEIRITRSVPCSTCNGQGTDPNTPPKTCPECKGSGHVDRSRGYMKFSSLCPECEGEGKLSSPCPACHGRGTVPSEEGIRVTIPPGVDNGSKVRVAGKGYARISGGPSRALFVMVNVAEHPVFKRAGDNIRVEGPITGAEAALGAQ